MRPVFSTPGHHGSVPHDEENDTSELGAEFFGTYSVILPPEPFIFRHTASVTVAPENGGCELAREILEYAGTLVKVKAGIFVFQLR
jgi:hypothetical protein